MSVRRGPTERDRSEGIPTKEEPNQEHAPLVTWGAFPSNSPKAKQSAPRQTPLMLILILSDQAAPPLNLDLIELLRPTPADYRAAGHTVR